MQTLLREKLKDISLPPKEEKILVAMSGGIDSAVTALLLKEMGYEVAGIHLVLWKNRREEQHRQDLEKVGKQLEIPLFILELEALFQEAVVNYFLESYKNVSTPNPCVECNRKIKFGALWNFAKESGFRYLATGHYARIFKRNNKRYTLQDAVDSGKNQVYYLYAISQEALQHSLFPLGSFTKEEIRKIARDYGLHVAEKQDSQEVCFIENNDYRKFLEEQRVTLTPGYFRDINGNILGTHRGKEFFTIGQRKGMGISWKEPLYVIHIQEDGDILVGPLSRAKFRSFEVEKTNFLYYSDEEMVAFASKPLSCRVQIRYRSRPQKAYVTYLGNDTATDSFHQPRGHRLKVVLEEPVPGVAPGQSAVFYPDDTENPGNIILFGGVIARENLSLHG